MNSLSSELEFIKRYYTISAHPIRLDWDLGLFTYYRCSLS